MPRKAQSKKKSDQKSESSGFISVTQVEERYFPKTAQKRKEDWALPLSGVDAERRVKEALAAIGSEAAKP